MRTALVAFLAVLLMPASALAARPVPASVVGAVDRKVPVANYMPTRMLPSFSFQRWSFKAGVLWLRFVNKAGVLVDWTVAPMKGTCRAGMQKSFQLAGNKVWWADDGDIQRAWRCVFAADGVARRLTASSTTPPTRLADVGLGAVVASGKRY
jgi:hypothetical protein